MYPPHDVGGEVLHPDPLLNGHGQVRPGLEELQAAQECAEDGEVWVVSYTIDRC